MFVQALRSEKGALHEEEAKLIRFERWVLKDWIRTETFLKSFSRLERFRLRISRCWEAINLTEELCKWWFITWLTQFMEWKRSDKCWMLSAKDWEGDGRFMTTRFPLALLGKGKRTHWHNQMNVYSIQYWEKLKSFPSTAGIVRPRPRMEDVLFLTFYREVRRKLMSSGIIYNQ